MTEEYVKEIVQSEDEESTVMDGLIESNFNKLINLDLINTTTGLPKLPLELFPDDEDQVEMYAFFKQAMFGDCTYHMKPYWFKFSENVKYKMWKSLSGVKSVDAKKQYLIKLLQCIQVEEDSGLLDDNWTRWLNETITLESTSEISNDDVISFSLINKLAPDETTLPPREVEVITIGDLKNKCAELEEHLVKETHIYSQKIKEKVKEISDMERTLSEMNNPDLSIEEVEHLIRNSNGSDENVEGLLKNLKESYQILEKSINSTNMGKQSSSRVTKKKKVNLIKKKMERDRKVRKAAKKGIALPRNKLKKDLGIPNLVPDKKQILEKIYQKKQEEKQQKEKEQLSKKNNRVETQKENSRLSEMAHLQYMAQRKQMEFNAKENLIKDGQGDSFDARDVKQASLSTASKRAYYKEFNKTVEASDVIIEVLDARDPMGCRCLNIEKAILSKHMNKKIILLLNKIDMVPREVVTQWLEYLRKEFPTIAFKSNTQKQSKNLSQGSTEDMKGCLGADTLMQLLKNYARSEDIKKSIAVGIIGYPNVGKSSVINSLKRQRVAVVGSRPGVTTCAKEIQLDSNIKLIDSPGIIFSSASLDSDVILRNAVRIEQLEDTVEPVRIILKRCKPERLMRRYNVQAFTTAEEFLTQVAKQSGKLLKGSKPNIQEAGKIVLRDWNTGKISFYTLPPKRGENVVEQFNMDNAMMQIDDSNVLNKLTSVNDPNNEFIPMTSSKPIEDDVFITVDSDDEDGDAEMEDGDEVEEEGGSDVEIEDEDD